MWITALIMRLFCLCLVIGGLTSDILDNCVSARFSTKDNKMVYIFTPPTEASKYVDPHAKVEIANMFEAYNKAVRGVEQKAQEVRLSLDGMKIGDMAEQSKASYEKVVVKKKEDEGVGEEKKQIKGRRSLLSSKVKEGDDDDFEDAEEDYDEDEEEVVIQTEKGEMTVKKDSNTAIRLEVERLRSILIRLWNEMHHESVSIYRDFIYSQITDIIDNGETEIDDVESLSEEQLNKKAYMCGKCKAKGVMVPKRGHVCQNIGET